MTKLNEKLHLARIVLRELERGGPLRWSELEKRTIKQCGTTGTFKAIMRFLKSNHYVEKLGSSHTDPYTITEKGLRFLRGIAE